MTARFIWPEYGNYSRLTGHDINVYDDLFVQYDTLWPATNLTLVCILWNGSNKPYWILSPSNPLPASGLHDIGTPVSWGVTLDYRNVFPTYCSLRLTRSNDNNTGLDGEIFSMTSDPSTSTIYSPSPLATANTVYSPSPLATANTVPSRSWSADATSSGLNTGAKVGIGVGAGTIFVVISGVLIGAYLKRRSKSRRAPSEKESIPGMYGTATKHEMDGIGLSRFHWLRARSREVDDTTIHELDDPRGRAPEMDGTDQGPHELECTPMSQGGAEVYTAAQ